jgi:hypothetical protein
VEATIWHWLLPRKWFEESATCTVNNRTNQHRLPSYITMSGSTEEPTLLLVLSRAGLPV